MKFLIRPATKNDMPQVLSLIKELAIFEKEPDAVIVTVEDLIEKGFGDHPLFTCFVAHQKEEIFGIALVYFRYSTWKGKTVHLEDLIVKKHLRGRGIGIALYHQVLLYAYQHQVKRVEWAVLDWNKNAINFYENSGAKILKDWYIAQMDEVTLKNYLTKNKLI